MGTQILAGSTGKFKFYDADLYNVKFTVVNDTCMECNRIRVFCSEYGYELDVPMWRITQWDEKRTEDY